MDTLILIILILALLFVLAVMGRKGHPGLSKLRGWSYAHRGLHDENRPENSMSAFEAALNGGYGIEFDVHLLADGNLAVMHDASLKRTAGADIQIETLTTGHLQNYRLNGSGAHIPLFTEVLELFDGKAPLIIELKPMNGNHDALTEATCKALEGYKGAYCIESFDPRCIHWLKKNRPDIIRGQLTENFVRNAKTMPFVLRFILTHQLENFLIRPDFVAYKFADRKTLSNYIVRGLWGVQGVSWTIRSQADYDAAVEEGWLPIFEGFRP